MPRTKKSVPAITKIRKSPRLSRKSKSILNSPPTNNNQKQKEDTKNNNNMKSLRTRKLPVLDFNDDFEEDDGFAFKRVSKNKSTTNNLINNNLDSTSIKINTRTTRSTKKNNTTAKSNIVPSKSTRSKINKRTRNLDDVDKGVNEVDTDLLQNGNSINGNGIVDDTESLEPPRKRGRVSRKKPTTETSTTTTTTADVDVTTKPTKTTKAKAKKATTKAKPAKSTKSTKATKATKSTKSTKPTRTTRTTRTTRSKKSQEVDVEDENEHENENGNQSKEKENLKLTNGSSVLMNAISLKLPQLPSPPTPPNSSPIAEPIHINLPTQDNNNNNNTKKLKTRRGRVSKKQKVNQPIQEVKKHHTRQNDLIQSQPQEEQQQKFQLNLLTPKVPHIELAMDIEDENDIEESPLVTKAKKDKVTKKSAVTTKIPKNKTKTKTKQSKEKIINDDEYNLIDDMEPLSDSEPQQEPIQHEQKSETDNENESENEYKYHSRPSEGIKIALPFSDTPIIRRNKQLRNEAKGPRRSSLGRRGKRASSIGNGFVAIPHESIPDKEFYKHLDVDLPEPHRMRQLAVWCCRRVLDSFIIQQKKLKRQQQKLIRTHSNSVQKATLLSDDISAMEIAKVIREELLREVSDGKINTSWWGRDKDKESNTNESGINENEIKIKMLPNSQNLKNQENLIVFEHRLKQLENEKKLWDDRLKEIKDSNKNLFIDKLSKLSLIDSEQSTSSSASTSASASTSTNPIPNQFKSITNESIINTLITQESLISQKTKQLEYNLDKLNHSTHLIDSIDKISNDFVDKKMKYISSIFNNQKIDDENLKLFNSKSNQEDNENDNKIEQQKKTQTQKQKQKGNDNGKNKAKIIGSSDEFRDVLRAISRVDKAT